MGEFHARPIAAMALAMALLSIAGGAGPPTRAPARGPSATASRRVLPDDDATFRPTVIVRKGNSQGSGTIIASADGETLILTASHVVAGADGSVTVDLQRYNLGLERFSKVAGGWPRTLPAEVVGMDRAADLAVLRIGRMKRLPYVARVDRGVEEPARGTVVTSVGIDLGERLSSWRTHVEGVGWFRLEKQDEDRPFLVTSKPPEHGRSGGGLFSPDGVLVGVCIGRAGVGEKKGTELGIFAAAASVRRLLRDHDLEQAVARSSPPPRAAGRAGPSTAPGPITPTEATRVAPPGRR